MARKILEGGENLTKALGALADRIKRGGEVNVGFLEGATNTEGVSIPMYAAVNEFGAPSRGQPPRPFFRNMIAAKSAEWPKEVADALKAFDYDVPKTLDFLGQSVQGDLRQSIIDLVDPPLAPSTIKRKGFDKPLINKGDMLNAVNYEVKA